jgi:hypothetical protein
MWMDGVGMKRAEMMKQTRRELKVLADQGDYDAIQVLKAKEELLEIGCKPFRYRIEFQYRLQLPGGDLGELKEDHMYLEGDWIDHPVIKVAFGRTKRLCKEARQFFQKHPEFKRTKLIRIVNATNAEAMATMGLTGEEYNKLITGGSVRSVAKYSNS